MEKSNEFFASVAQDRANKINKDAHKRNQQKVDSTKRELLKQLEDKHGKEKMFELRKESMGTLWREFVKNKNDAHAFMEVMYPEFPDAILRAYVDMFERAIQGKIKLADTYKFNKDEPSNIWDVNADVEKEKLKGYINNSEKAIEELLKDS